MFGGEGSKVQSEVSMDVKSNGGSKDEGSLQKDPPVQ